MEELDIIETTDYMHRMAEGDTIQEAFRQVQGVTDSEPTNGEELLGSPELRRQFREAEQRLKEKLPKPPREKSVE